MSQEYTPVEWVDETPTQIGTVINKARLDQMQSAHHYADGFEEVDSIPTDDPGVDYHKVVYCTADSSFYRWDGSQWTKDVDDDTKALLLAHEADHNNPHVVTKAQVGLGNVENRAIDGTPTEGSTNYIESGAVYGVQADIDGHIANKANPHQVTKSQIGLGNVDNTSDIAKPISNATQVALAEKIGTDKIVGSWSNDPDNAHIPGEKLAKDSIDAVATDVSAIEGKIPAQASPSNQLADKDFVNSSIATNTANFLGTYDAENDLGFASATVDTWTDPPSSSVEASVGSAISTKLSALGKTATNNDYVFVSVDQSATVGTNWYWRFKFNGSAWVYEFTLNNSSFTADQWAAINSGITTGLVSSYSAHVASTSNPHSVTKAQVGLGNVDNTSDMNKPVSTAQATAISAKVDKLTTKPTAGTYTKVTINSEGQVTAGSTLAATDIPSLDWSKITSGKPTTLAGYGITDAVTIDTAQTITGLKTLQGGDNCLFLKSTSIDLSSVGTSANARITCYDKNGNGNNDRVGIIRFFRGSNGLNSAYLTIANRVDGVQTYKDLSVTCDIDGTAYASAPHRAYNSANTSDIVTIGLMTANAVTIADAQTITGDKTFTPSTSGAVTVVGLGNASNQRPLWRCKFTGVPSGSAPASAVWGGMQFTNTDDAEIGSVTFNRNATASYINLFLKNVDGVNTSLRVWKEDGGDAYATCPSRTYNSANTNDVVTIGSLKNSTDVVKTKGSQTIEADNSTMTLALKRNIDLSTITSSTPISDLIFTAINGSNTNFMGGRMQYRRYANRSRIWFSLYRLTNGDETALMFEQYDNGRAVLLLNNIVNGVATAHTIIDSTP